MKQVFQTQLTDIVSSSEIAANEGVGTKRYENDGVYRFVKNAEASTALVAGQLVCHTISDGVDTFKNVKIPLTANLSLLGGVALSAIPAGQWGWIKIQGQHATVSVSGATTGGTNIAAGDYLKAANGVTYGVRDAATQPAYNRNVQVLVAVTTTTTPTAAAVACSINCNP